MSNAIVTQAVAEAVWAAPIKNAVTTWIVADVIWAAPIKNAVTTWIVAEVIWSAGAAEAAGAGFCTDSQIGMSQGLLTPSPFLGV